MDNRMPNPQTKQVVQLPTSPFPHLLPYLQPPLSVWWDLVQRGHTTSSTDKPERYEGTHPCQATCKVVHSSQVRLMTTAVKPLLLDIEDPHSIPEKSRSGVGICW